MDNVAHFRAGRPVDIICLGFARRGSSINKQGNRVSAENLDKTRRCFGQRVRDICEDTNQSSHWTADANKAKAFVSPMD